MILMLSVQFAMVCFGVGLLMNVWLLLRGASVVDRILALDTMVVNAIGLIVLYGIYTQNGMNFQAALLLALTGFVGTVAYCKFLLRGDVIE